MNAAALARQLDLWARHAAPVAFTLALAFLSVLPLPIPDYGVLAPQFVLMAVYYWTIHRPDLMTAPLVFAIGLAQDLLHGGPVGINVLILLTVHRSLRSPRRVFLAKTFAVAWSGFSLMSLAAAVAAVVLVWVARGGPPSIGLVVMQWALSALLYPTLAALLSRAQRAYLRTA